MGTEFWVSQAWGFILGIIAGWVSSLIARQIRDWRLRRIERVAGVSPLGFDPRAIAFFTLNRWSPSRLLIPGLLETQYLQNRTHIQTWCNPDELRKIRTELQDPGGPSCSLADIEIDHRESARGKVFRMYVEQSEYIDLLCVGEYFRRHEDEVELILDRLRNEDTREMVRGAPCSVIAANIVVLSADRKLLAIERSAAVRTSQNLWTLGPNETMNWQTTPRPGEKKEDLFELAERCLWEETGIDRTEHGQIYISWIGYNVPGALVHIVALTKTNLTSSVISERIASAHGAFEAQQIAWLEPDAAVLREIAMDENALDRKWIDSARLAAQEFWRFRLLLLHDAVEMPTEK